MSSLKINHITVLTKPIIKQKGFSLIEFMVASLIGIIVLLAAGSTFMMTRHLNQQASERLAAQQDLRYASNLIIRDARQAGSFGCANLADNNVKVVNGSGVMTTSPLYLRQDWHETAEPNHYGLQLIDANTFLTDIGSAPNFSGQGDALIFIYSVGSAGINQIISNPGNQDLAESLNLTVESHDAVAQTLTVAGVNISAPLVLSSCDRIKVLNRNGDYSVVNPTQIELSPGVLISPDFLIDQAFRPGQLSLSKLAASAYVVGSFDNSNMIGLYRFTLQIDGTWSQPQLLVSDLSSTNGMTVQFGYVETNACPAGLANTNENYQFRTSLQNEDNYSKLPALIRIRLNVLDGTSRSNSNTDIGQMQEYIIDAAVRGGNMCSNRSF